MFSGRLAVVSVLTLLVALVPGATSTAFAETAPVDVSGSAPAPGAEPDLAQEDRIGIRLLEAPVIRRDDPRARISIVDHLPPGITIQRRIAVTNTSANPRRIEVFPGAAKIAHNRFVVSSNRTPNELATWISVDRPVLDMPPDSTAQVRVTIKVPQDAAKGERYAVVWAQTGTPPGPSGNVGLKAGVGIRVYLDIGPGGEPPSDFKIENLTPGRTDDGHPQVLARIRNTGGRALDMSGTLSLSDGPGGLNAGPYPAKVGTNLLPGDTAPVTVVLNKQLPNGPWKVRLTLESGRVKHTVTATLTFPKTRGSFGLPVSLDSPMPLTLTLTGLLGAAAAVVLLVVALRRARLRPQLRSAR